MPRLPFGERVRRLEREFRARGKTQKELAESLGVTPRTVQRWKGREEAPSGPGSKAVQEIGGRRENVVRKRERYYYRYAPKETEPVAEPPPKDRRSLELSDEDLGVLDRPAYVFPSPREALADNPALARAVEGGGRLTFHVRGSRVDRAPEEDSLETRTIFLPEGDPEAARQSFVSAVFRSAREVMDAEGTSDLTLEIVGAAVG